MRPPVIPRVLIPVILLGIFGIGESSYCQVQSMTSSNIGTKNTFSYSIQSTYGVSTSANASANFQVDNEAILKLKAGSFVTNKFGNDQDQAAAVFTASPTGANVDLQGISAKNLLLIDDGTYFRSSMKSVANPDPTLPTQATASAQANHVSTISIENGQSSFTQTLSTSF